MRATLHKASIALLISFTAGCMSTGKDQLLPQSGPTMEEVYKNHLNATHTGKSQEYQAQRKLSDRDIDRDSYTRDAKNEIDVLFPRLPNPTLVMYVFPHLSTESRLPVPGYSTAFPLYERPEYAMPGEQ